MDHFHFDFKTSADIPFKSSAQKLFNMFNMTSYKNTCVYIALV